MAVTGRWAFRVRMSREGKTLKFLSAARVEMLVPSSISLEGAEHESGAWFLLQDSNGRGLYRRPLGNPFSDEREVMGGEDREFSRVKVTSSTRTISLLVPELVEAETLVIYASETEGPKAHQPAQPVFRVSMREVKSMAARKGDQHGRE